jgi:hypothetical protein
LRRIGLKFGTGVVVALALAVAGCGSESNPPPPQSPFAEALATVGGGGANGSLGVGWAEPRLVSRLGAGRDLIGRALGPNARTVVEEASRLRRRFGLDPLAASRLVSVGGSYAFGLRIDGTDGSGLERALVKAGGRTREADGVKLVDAADYAVVPEPLLRSRISGLGARDAFSSDRTILAISDTARDALLGRGDRLIDEPTYAAAADCLGDVIVARMIPDNLLLSTDVGVNAVAIGVSGAKREALCVLGGTAGRAEAIAASLKMSLAPSAREPVTGNPIGDSVAHVQVRRYSYAGIEVVRAELQLASHRSRGFLFETVSHGSLVRMMNAG